MFIIYIYQVRGSVRVSGLCSCVRVTSFGALINSLVNGFPVNTVVLTFDSRDNGEQCFVQVLFSGSKASVKDSFRLGSMTRRLPVSSQKGFDPNSTIKNLGCKKD